MSIQKNKGENQISADQKKISSLLGHIGTLTKHLITIKSLPQGQ